LPCKSKYIAHTTNSVPDQGIRAESTGLVHADDVDVDAVSVGIDTGDAGPFLLTRSQVHALEAVRGTLTAEGRTTSPAAAEPARGHRDPADPAGGVAAGDRGLRGRRLGDTRRIPPPAGAAAPTAVPSAGPMRGPLTESTAA
jgi:hypothetical protein